MGERGEKLRALRPRPSIRAPVWIKQSKMQRWDDSQHVIVKPFAERHVAWRLCNDWNLFCYGFEFASHTGRCVFGLRCLPAKLTERLPS